MQGRGKNQKQCREDPLHANLARRKATQRKSPPSRYSPKRADSWARWQRIFGMLRAIRPKSYNLEPQLRLPPISSYLCCRLIHHIAQLRHHHDDRGIERHQQDRRKNRKEIPRRFLGGRAGKEYWGCCERFVRNPTTSSRSFVSHRFLHIFAAGYFIILCSCVIIMMTAGPSVTSRTEGKIRKNTRKISFTPILRADS